MRKVAVTARQLAIRYKVYQESYTRNLPFTMLMVARWQANLTDNERLWKEKQEPLNWLRHLEKRGTTAITRSGWVLSGKVIEDSFMLYKYRSELPNFHPPLSPFPGLPDADFRFPSQTSASLSHEELPLSRSSFEALQRINRPSLDVMSQRSGNSTFSSLFSSPSNSNLLLLTGTTSPPTSNLQSLHSKERTVVQNGHARNDSEGAASANFSTKSDVPSVHSVSLAPNLSRISDVKEIKEEEHSPPPLFDYSASPTSVDIKEPKPQAPALLPAIELLEKPEDIEKPKEAKQSPAVSRLLDRRAHRISLPSMDRLSTIIESHQHENQSQVDHEYELKSQYVLL
jgi:hypothetical protein